MAILKDEGRYYTSAMCQVCKERGTESKPCVIRYPPGTSRETGGSQYAHDACSTGWQRVDGSTVRPSGTKKKPVRSIKQSPIIEPNNRKSLTTAGALRHVSTEQDAGNRWASRTHSHGLKMDKLREYMAVGRTEGIDIYCPYVGWYPQNFTKVRFEHKEILKLADLKGIKLHVCETIVEREVIKEVIRPIGMTEMSIGETASLTASLHHGQHLINDDLRRALVADDKAEVAKYQARLADHISMMAKLGVEPAPWTDNHHALLRAGRLAVEFPIDDTLWS